MALESCIAAPAAPDEVRALSCCDSTPADPRPLHDCGWPWAPNLHPPRRSLRPGGADVLKVPVCPLATLTYHTREGATTHGPQQPDNRWRSQLGACLLVISCLTSTLPPARPPARYHPLSQHQGNAAVLGDPSVIHEVAAFIKVRQHELPLSPPFLALLSSLTSLSFLSSLPSSSSSFSFSFSFSWVFGAPLPNAWSPCMVQEVQEGTRSQEIGLPDTFDKFVRQLKGILERNPAPPVEVRFLPLFCLVFCRAISSVSRHIRCLRHSLCGACAPSAAV